MMIRDSNGVQSRLGDVTVLQLRGRGSSREPQDNVMMLNDNPAYLMRSQALITSTFDTLTQEV